MFLDEDWNIDRDVLDALEAKAIKYVREHGSYETDNLPLPILVYLPIRNSALNLCTKAFFFAWRHSAMI